MRTKLIKRVYRNNKRFKLVSKKRYKIVEAFKFQLILSQLEFKKRQTVVDKTLRFMNIDIKGYASKNKKGRFSPEFKKFEFAHCHFTGIGYEWDFPHFALIWDIDPYMDSVLVIPTTSVQRDEYIDVFSVNQIKGLPKGNTHLLISDMTRISRKRLEKIEYTHPVHGKTNPMLPKSWESRVHHGIISRTLQIPSFEKIITNKCGMNMVNSLVKYNELKFKAIIDFKFDFSSKILTYRIWDNSSYDTIQLVAPNSSVFIQKEDKQKKLQCLNSKNPVISSLAKQFFFEIYGI